MEDSKLKMGIFVIAGYIRSIFKLSIVISFITLIMSHFLGLSQWTVPFFDNMRVVELCTASFKSSVLMGIALDVALMPICFVLFIAEQDREYIKRMQNLTDEEDRYICGFARRAMIVSYICLTVSYVAVGLIAFLAHDPVMTILGNPITDILTVILLRFGPAIMDTPINEIAAGDLKRENPDLYNTWLETVAYSRF